MRPSRPQSETAEGPPRPEPAGEEGLPAGFLLAVVFFTGWAMMSLEILGGRVLQADFGNEIHVWGSIIGVFLISLAAGYLAGGKLSLRIVHPRVLAAALVASGLVVLGIPFARRAISGSIADRLDDGAWGCLLAATLLFFLPTALLGIVSPYSVRLGTRRVASVGDRAGQLYAVSTVGSFLGTIATSFYLVVWMGTDKIFWLHGAGLIALGAAIEVVTRILRNGRT